MYLLLVAQGLPSITGQAIPSLPQSTDTLNGPLRADPLRIDTQRIEVDLGPGPIVLPDAVTRSVTPLQLPITTNPFDPAAALRPPALLSRTTAATPTPQVPTPAPTTWLGGVRESLARGWDATSAAWHGARATGTAWLNTAVNTGKSWINWARVNVSALIDRARNALGFASAMKPLSQMDQPRPNVACYRTCELMGRKAGLTFSPNGGPDTLQANTPEAARRFLGDLAGGIPVMIPVDYKPGTQASGDAADHCIVAQSIVSWEPLQIRCFDPRSRNPEVQVQTLTYDPATGELSGGNWPYRITQMRFATNVTRPWSDA